MGRFKYIPQRYKDYINGKEVLENNSSLLDSEPIDISITDTPNIEDTLIVYDDYKIPINITEDLLNQLYLLQYRINTLYIKINEINKILEETTKDYNSFENKVFGYSRYLHDYHVFDHNYDKFNLDSVKDNGSSKPLTGKSKSVISEYVTVKQSKELIKYIKNLSNIEYNTINNMNIDTIPNRLQNKLDTYTKKYNDVYKTSSWKTKNNEWINENKNSIKENKDKVELMQSSLKSMFGTHMVDSIVLKFDDGTSETIIVGEEE